MKRNAVLVLAAMAGSLLGCNWTPVAVPVENVAFPAVLILGKTPTSGLSHHASIVVDRADLGTLRVEKYSSLPDPKTAEPPIVIDANATVLEMRDIEGEHGGLWMMANPTGLMPINFKLVQREPSGIEAARALIAECRFIGRDLDSERTAERRERIRRAQSMAEILQIVDEMPPPEPIP